MPKTSTPEKNRGVPPNEPEQKVEAPANEFCSMNNSLAYSYACFGLNIFSNTSYVFSPLILIIPIPPIPGAVEIAAIVLMFTPF